MDKGFQILSGFQDKFLTEVKRLSPVSSYLDWKYDKALGGEGIFACGWTKEDLVLMISYDGYDILSPETGEIIITNKENGSYHLMSNNNLEFSVPELKESVRIFGLYGGNGNHVLPDGWKAKIISPRWPNSVVALWRPDNPQEVQRIWEGMRLLKLKLLEYNDLYCGFSNNQKHLLISSNHGAEIYSRNID